MTIKFTKMHGLGNDFMVIDGINQQINLNKSQIAAWGNRNTGIGFDQCLLVESSTTEGIDFNYRIFNADGQEVGQCGNGARCLALFVSHYGLTTKRNIRVATKTTTMTLQINKDKTVSVDMGIPRLNPHEIPLDAAEQREKYQLNLDDGTTQEVHAINVGNPHAILIVDDVYSIPVNILGPQISRHPSFPEQCNAGFMQIINPEHIKLRVYERGCGETQACGSGAVAAAAIGRLYHQLGDQISVSLPGGNLTISWPILTASLILTGPAEFIYEATLINS